METDSLNICSLEDVSDILSVKSNIGKQPLKLVRQHFPKGHKLNKIFHKNTLKVSYSFTRNMSSILSSHIRMILAENEKQYECNCRNKVEHLLENKCFTPQVIYEADGITLNTTRMFYIGLSDTTFKERYNNHKRDFRNRGYDKSTQLSQYIWTLQENGIEFTTHWKILSQVRGMTKSGVCSLCLTEKYVCSIILTIYTYLIRNLNSLANVIKGLSY